MKSESRRRNSIIPKIIVILGTLSVAGIILLFFRDRPVFTAFNKKPETSEKLFAQVIESSLPEVQRLWEEGGKMLGKEAPRCPTEIAASGVVGRSYYQCQPHLWQCYWSGGLPGKEPIFKIDLFGQTFHVRAIPHSDGRYYKMLKTSSPDFPHRYGMVVKLQVREIPGKTQTLFLADSCRDSYLPERIYGHGKLKDKKDKGFNWDNFGRRLFIDKFYVSQQQVNVWRELAGQKELMTKDPVQFPLPAALSLKEQKDYCAFFGKRLLEAKLFDAATMTPPDLQNPMPDIVTRAQTPWQRDHSKTFLGVARINPDYQLTPLDCQLAQVKGCKERYYTTDSATWNGIFYGLGFEQESFDNFIEPSKNLKLSSRHQEPGSPWQELGLRASWDGVQGERRVAFRCYEEVEP